MIICFPTMFCTLYNLCVSADVRPCVSLRDFNDMCFVVKTLYCRLILNWEHWNESILVHYIDIEVQCLRQNGALFFSYEAPTLVPSIYAHLLTSEDTVSHVFVSQIELKCLNLYNVFVAVSRSCGTLDLHTRLHAMNLQLLTVVDIFTPWFSYPR